MTDASANTPCVYDGLGLSAERSAPTALSRRAATLLAFTALAVFLVASSAPTPLYRLYQQDFGLTPLMLTVVFAAYSFGLLGSLLTLGSLSDHLGRRPVALAALAVNALAMVVFIFANSVGLLIAARLVQGFGAGVAATAIGAAVVDLSPTRGPTLNAVAPFTGLTVGALGSAALITYAPAPEHTVYGVLLVVTLLLLAALWRMPETAKAELGAWASLVPRVHVPRAARKTLAAITPINVAGWTLGGFYFSLVPSLVRVATGLGAPLIGAAVVAALTATATLSVLMVRRWNPRTTLAFATLVLASGVGVILLGVHMQSVLVLIGGSLFTGLGFGATLSGNMRTLLPLALPDERAGLLSAFYVESYLAFSVTAILAGLVTPLIGLTTTAFAGGGIVIGLALTSFVLTRVHRREPAQQS
jgi:predicted MFS family arabinose efflux permease